MVLQIIIGSVVVFALFLAFKAFVGKSKPAEQRSSWEKIACTLLVMGRKNVDDAANSMRTARVMKTEAIQEVNDALKSLNDSYKMNMTSLKIALKQMKGNDDGTGGTLARLKDQPGKLEGKARKAKKDYEASVAKGTPIEAHKNNAKKYLQMKAKAVEDIKRCEKTIEKLEITIETAKAEYDGRKFDLEMIKSDLECIVDIPQLELNQSLEKIRSLQSELVTRMDQDNIRAEVTNEMINEESNSSYSYSSDIDAEFDNL